MVAHVVVVSVCLFHIKVCVYNLNIFSFKITLNSSSSE